MGANGLWGYWRMDEAGNPAADSSGNGRHFSYAAYDMSKVHPGSPARLGSGLRLSGLGAIQKPGTVAAPNTTNFTAELWVKLGAQQSSTSAVNLFHYGYSLGSPAMWRIYDGRLNISYPRDFATAGWKAAGPRLDDGAWHHVAVSRDHGQRVVVYIDGAAVGTAAAERAAGSYTTTSTNLAFGNYTGTSTGIDVTVDGAAFYTTVLSADQIARHWGAADDGRGPALSFSEALWDHRNRSDDHRNEGLYDPTAELLVNASDGTATDRGSGVVSIEIQVDGQRVDYTSQLCLTWSCQMTRRYSLNVDAYSDGEHTVKVIAKDRVGNASEQSWTVTSDRRGDIYRADHLKDSANTLVGTDWAKLNARRARRETPIFIKTRLDAEARMRTIGSDSDPSDEDVYWVRTSDNPEDPNLPAVASFVDTRDEAQGSGWTAVTGGDLISVLELWQTPPPGHGQRYEQRRRIADGRVTDVWVDDVTKAPVKRVTRDQASDAVIEALYWSYDKQRRSDSEVPANFFQVSRSEQTGFEEEERFSSDGEGTMAVEDEETQTSFGPRYLGTSTTLDAGTFCFTRALTHRQRLLGASAQATDDPEMEDMARGYAGRSAPSTGVDAYYVPRLSGAACGSGPETALDTPPLMVWTMAADSSEARAWSAVYRREGTHVATNPLDDDFAFAGILPVLIDGAASDAYVMRDDAGPWSSFLVQVGNQTVIVRGPLTKSEIPVVAANLRPL